MNYTSIIKKFEKLYLKEPRVFRAPGRINLIGEHTDYNDGLVLPAAIDREIVYALAPNGTDTCRVYAMDLGEEDEINLNQIKVSEKRWNNYLIGVVAVLENRGIKIGGFDCVFSGNIPIGGGLSSSAALECGLGVGLNELFDLKLDQREIAFIAQQAEHEYAGVLCGIMDQFASMFGKENHVFRLDCRSLEIDYFPFKLDDLKIILFDTGVSHQLASSEYNKRRAECEQGVSFLQKNGHDDVSSLRDVSQEKLLRYKDELDATVLKRCLYVIEENNRVVLACKKLEEKDFEGFGALMYASHNGLSQEYEVSCTELDFLVDYTKDKENVLGARMMGGGFGGCTINLVKEEGIEEFIKKIESAYLKETGFQLKTFVTEIKEGAGKVPS